MGFAFVLLGLLSAGVVVDFVVENDVAANAERTYSLFGGSFTISDMQLVIGAAVLGVLAVVLVFLGVGLLRGSWGRRRAIKHRVVELERENTSLRSKAHLAESTSTPTPPEARTTPEVPADQHA